MYVKYLTSRSSFTGIFSGSVIDLLYLFLLLFLSEPTASPRNDEENDQGVANMCIKTVLLSSICRAIPVSYTDTLYRVLFNVDVNAG